MRLAMVDFPAPDGAEMTTGTPVVTFMRAIVLILMPPENPTESALPARAAFPIPGDKGPVLRHAAYGASRIKTACPALRIPCRQRWGAYSSTDVPGSGASARSEAPIPG